MRIHQLSVTAFGPFADRVDVDLDALSAGGLFLIHGATGAGKTSLLDAICYALYANVPGARARSKKNLRSDHAPRDRMPEVTLEFTADGQRMRLSRSPEYDRPKKRGTGEVSVPARVSLEVLHGTRWEVVSTRADEVGEKVNDLIGMGLAQFSKVAVLPQGEFAAFLRASAEDRRAVLERLFDITAFADVESWLADERRRTAAEAAAMETAVSHALARVKDVASDGWDTSAADTGAADTGAADTGAADTDGADTDGADTGGADTGGAATVDAEDLSGELTALLATAETTVTETLAATDAATLADDAAATALGEARARATHRSRGERAVSDLSRLDAERDDHLARQSVIASAERAAALDGHLLARRRALAEVEATETALSAAAADVTLSGLSVGTLDTVGLLATLRAGDESARDLEAARRRASTVSSRLATLAGEMAEVEALVTRATAAHQVATADRQRAADDLAAAESIDHDVAVAQAEFDRVAALQKVARAVAEDRAVIVKLEDERRSTHERSNEARTRQLDLRERYLGALAAELAEDLRDDEPCLVCGSTEHPAPARATDRVGRGDLDEAEAAAARANEAHLAATVAVERLTAGIEAQARHLGTADVAELDARAVDVHAALCSAQEQVQLIARAEVALGEAAETLMQARTTLEQATSAQQALGCVREEVAAEAAGLAERVTALVETHSTCPCMTTAAEWSIQRHDRLSDALESSAAAAAALASARQALSSAEADAAKALQDNGFETIDAVESARRTGADLATLRGAVTDHERARTTALAALDDPDVTLALNAPPDDLTALATAAASARQHLLGVTREHSRAEARRADLARLVPALLGDHARSVDARRVAEQVRELADVVGGLGPNNVLKMRLTSYVLAARLESVVNHANERLATLGAGRYLLEHTDERAGGGRSGLGLRVLDQWTGQFRDPASLSGGETFMASLSLALGLADAVRADSGGYDLGTLFIDEGFGSLDDESLEEVMGVLDGLQAGGRSVGIVSHVADLRTRIPRQLVVHKTPEGSTVTTDVGAPLAS